MPEEPSIALRLPAQGSYVSFVRRVAIDVGARSNLSVDDLEELRIAISEACALVLDRTSGEGSMNIEFTLAEGSMVVEISGPSEAQSGVDRSSFAWQVLASLSDEVETPDTLSNRSVRFRISSSV